MVKTLHLPQGAWIDPSMGNKIPHALQPKNSYAFNAKIIFTKHTFDQVLRTFDKAWQWFGIFSNT